MGGVLVSILAVLAAAAREPDKPKPKPPVGPVSRLSWLFKTNSSLGYCHMAMIEATSRDASAPNLRVFAAFQAARVHEGMNDQKIYFSVSTDSGETWGPLRTHAAVNTNGPYAVWGPSLFWSANTSELYLFYAQSGAEDQTTTPGRSGVGGDIMVVRSSDFGTSWTAPTLVHPFKYNGKTCPKITANKPIVLSDGRWVLPFWQTPQPNNTDAQAAGVLLSDDAGASWRPVMLWDAPVKLIENTVAETRTGSLVMLFRTGTGHLYRAFSRDGGDHWTTPEASEVDNPNAKTFVMTDSSGHQILACNPVKKGRNPLVLAISEDNGQSFRQFANLDPGMTTKALEYPTTTQIGSTILTVFSADHYTGIKVARTNLTTTMPQRERA